MSADDRTTLDAVGLPAGAQVGKVVFEQRVMNVLDRTTGKHVDVMLSQPGEGSATAYQRWTAETAVGGYPEAGTGSQAAINYAVIGLNDEAGEVAGKWKKLLRGDDGGDPEKRRARIDALQDEVGDVLWYAARIAAETGTTLDTIMARNRAKLMDRKRRGVIKGDGDTR